MTPQDQDLRRSDALIITICEEKSITALAPGLISIFCCIVGESAISSGNEIRPLKRGDILVCDAHAQHELTIATQSACLLIVGSAQAWKVNGRRVASNKRWLSVPVPATYRHSRSACAAFLRVARESAGGRTTGETVRIRALIDQVETFQRGLIECIARCPGSSEARKRAVYMRLQRARNLVETAANDDLDISKLAHAANYSIGHFITLFRLVFGETPYAAISRCRLANARGLLGESDLAVGEIAQSSGFPSPSSFTRAMKKHTGKSATEFRLAQRRLEDSAGVDRSRAL